MERTNKPNKPEYINKIPDCINCAISDNFTQIPNSLLRNPEITAKAKGILCLLLSNKTGWKSHVETICGLMADGKTSIQNGLKELEQKGYLKKILYREMDSKIRRGAIWCYTNEPNYFNMELEEITELLAEYRLELVPDIKLKRGNSTITWKAIDGKAIAGKPASNNTTFNNTKSKNTISFSLGKNTNENKTNKTLSNKVKEYLPHAEKLAAIIQSNKNIKIPPSRLNNWANEIRRLHQVEGVAHERIARALEWYGENIGGEYVPVIESGSTFRSKFIKLEDAMRRAGGLASGDKERPGTISLTVSPRLIIQSNLRGLAAAFEKDCYGPAKDIMPIKGKADRGKLARVLVDLYNDIESTQVENIPRNSTNLFPSPITIIRSYIDWIEDNDWIKDRSIQLFSTKHPLFSRFRREEARKDSIERDPLTGKSYMKG